VDEVDDVVETLLAEVVEVVETEEEVVEEVVVVEVDVVGVVVEEVFPVSETAYIPAAAIIITITTTMTMVAARLIAFLILDERE
jgi:hypothetical protein